MISSDSINIDLSDSNRKFEWLEISIVYDKSDKHTTIYDSYNVELAAKYIKSVKLSNFAEIYSLTTKKNMTLIIHHKNICCTSNLSLEAVTAAAQLP